MPRHAPKLGQNFLIDQAATLRIADALGDPETRTVVEIGPGHGAITAHLAPRCTRLHLPANSPSATATTRTLPSTTPTSSRPISRP